MKNLDPVSHDLSGFQIIEASAGCGKTYTITSIVLRLLVENGIDIETILLVTFTDAAAAELKNRIRARIKDMIEIMEGEEETTDPLACHFLSSYGTDAIKSLRRALSRLDRASISTIHGFCRRVLSEQAFESGVSFDASLTTEKDALFEEIACDLYANMTAAASPLLLEFFEEKKFGPDTLVSLMKTLFRTRELRILPPLRDIENPAPRYAEAYSSARKVLCAKRAEVETLLLTYPGLNRRSYRKDYVPKWLGQLTNFFSAARPRMDLPKAAEKFTGGVLAEQMKDGAPRPQHALFDAIDELTAARALFGEAFVQLKRRFIQDAYQVAAKFKEEREIQTFDDLLHSVQSALRGPSAEALIRSLQKKYKAVLIDEFQDTDTVQFEIFSKLFGGLEMPFFAIGDPKQSIYAFRGGDIYTYLDAVRTAGNKRATLSTNYRSDPAMIRAVNAVFSRTTNPFLFDEIQFAPVSGRPEVADAFTTTGARGAMALRFVTRALAAVPEDKPIPMEFAGEPLAALIAADIQQELGTFDDEGRVISSGRIAVLTRTNTQAAQIRDALEARGVSAVLLKDRSVFSTNEALDLLCLLRAVNEPAKIEAVRTAIAMRLFNLSAADIFGSTQDASSLDPWMARFAMWREMLSRFGIFKMFQSILALDLDGESLGAQMLSKADGERVMTNFRHLMELASVEQARTTATVFGLVQWLERRVSMTRDGETPAEETELRLDRDRDCVRLLTMHKSKGLEFDIVYCPYLWASGEGGNEIPIFHDATQRFVLTADLSDTPSATHLEQAQFERISESIRLAYVALTRAKQRTVVIFGAFKNFSESPAARLFFTADPTDWNDEKLLAALHVLVEAGDGAIRVSLATAADAVIEPYPADSKPDTLHTRSGPGKIPLPAVTTSFTAMIADIRSGNPTSETDERGDDAGEGTTLEMTADPFVAAPGPNENDDVLPGLITFERGALAGTCLHSIFERIDFESPDKGVFEATLAEFGSDSKWIDPLYGDVCAVLQHPLSQTEHAFSLRNISRAARLNELSFLFPITADTDFSSAVISLLVKGCTACPPDYPNSLAGIRASNWCGFLKGFIDLVFEHRGRYFVVDYKSNYLGPRVENYHTEAILRAMAEHHYFLQYHIYTLALHRYLSARMADYDFDAHFGGVYYLFIRGMTEPQSAPFGVFFDRPSRWTVQGLSAIFEGKSFVQQESTPIPASPTAQATVVIPPHSDQLTLPGFAASEGAHRKGKGR